MADDEARQVAPVQFFNDPQRAMKGIRDFTPQVTPSQPDEDAPDAVREGPRSSVYGGERKPSPEQPIVTDTKEQVIAAREWEQQKAAEAAQESGANTAPEQGAQNPEETPDKSGETTASRSPGAPGGQTESAPEPAPQPKRSREQASDNKGRKQGQRQK